MNSNSKINKEEKYPLQNTTLHGLELGIIKLERELNKEFNVD